MRLVFVNHAHPEIAHVSGMRLWYFAKALAKRGHQVVLLTCALSESSEANKGLAESCEQLGHHNWDEPLVVAIKPERRLVLELIRKNRPPPLIRRAATFFQFLVHGGMFADWQVPAKREAKRLAREFRPDLVWGTFGNSSTLMLAQWLARQAGCVWLMDIKDSWDAFVPSGLRRLMAWRLRNAAGWTSNAHYHQGVAARWFKREHSTVIYSGVADAFFGPPSPANLPKRDLLLVGGTYSDTLLRKYLGGVAVWMQGLTAAERAKLRFVYAGSDTERLHDALVHTPLPCETKVMTHLPIDAFALLARRAFANTYLRCATGFHHKLLELLICTQPVICYPQENDESMNLAAKINTPFASCRSTADLQAALTTAWGRKDDASRIMPPPWRWSDHAEGLEQFFRTFASKGQR